MQREEFAQVMDFITAAYPGQKWSKTTIDAYYQTLQDLPVEVFKGAAIKVSTTEEFVSIAKLRRAADNFDARIKGILDPYEAWERVMDAVRAGAGHPIIGSSDDYGLDELTIRSVRHIGGFATIGQSSMIASERIRFADAYKANVSRYKDKITEIPALKELQAKLALPAIGKDDA